MTASLPTKFTVGLVQMSMSDDPEANLGKAVARIREAARQGATLVCLPELFRTQYIGQREDHALFDLAEAVPGPSTETLGKVAKENGVVVIASLFERRAAGLYHNTAAVIDADGKVKGIYRKMHIPDDPAYYEKFYFTPGDLGFRAFDTKVGPIGTLVCWDQWYPEGARLTALQGANILLYPTAIGWHPAEKAQHGAQQLDAWQTIQRSHAIANGCWVAAVNRVGHERPGRGGGRRKDSCGGGRSAAHRRGPPQLAVLARPPHRRLQRHSAPVPDRLTPFPLACPPNGSRMRRPGSAGRTTSPTGPANFRRSPGSTPRSSAP